MMEENINKEAWEELQMKDIKSLRVFIKFKQSTGPML